VEGNDGDLIWGTMPIFIFFPDVRFYLHIFISFFLTVLLPFFFIYLLFYLFNVVQTGSGALPASYLMGTGDSFTGVKVAGA
jgi:hypothetical protein